MTSYSRNGGRIGALPFAAYYGAVFLALGVFLPFWPVWLGSRGLSAAEIGLVLALASWIKVASTPAIAHAADRSGQVQRALVVLSALGLASFAGFFGAGGFWTILVLTVPAAVCFQALVPLAESQTMSAVLRQNLDYGRIRLWGSLSFIAGTVGAGALLPSYGPDLILGLIVAALAVTLLAALALPRARPQAAPPTLGDILALLRRGRFVLFLAAASLLQASHAVYYGFSALHWRAAGLSASTVGWLWAEGVIAEVVLFALGARALARAGPPALLLLAGLAGLARWSVLAGSTDLPLLAAAQLLHAGTFGAAHLAAVHFIAGAAPAKLAATAQSLYAAVSGGIAMGLAMLAAGWLYAAHGGAAFLAMAGLSVLGGLLALFLWRRERRPG